MTPALGAREKDGMATVELKKPAAAATQRLISLDMLRGITIAFMILVNDNGSLTYAYWPLKHSAWNGWTPTDIIFPTFLFLVGVSIVFSMEARFERQESRATLLRHIFKRAIILFLLGLVVNGFPFFPLATLRIYGVLQRIAICYLAISILYLFSRKVLVLAATTVAALVGYWVLLRFVPVPHFGVPTHSIPLLDKNANWVAYIDRKIFPARLYNQTRDPEGLLSDIPSCVTTLLGVLAGLWLRTRQSAGRIAWGLFAAAVCCLLMGEVWSVSFPINKQLWTSSFVLLAAGWTLLALCICYFLTEIKQWRRGWTHLWLVFGSNAIVAYVFSELLASTLLSIHARGYGPSANLQDAIYDKVFYPIVNPAFGSLLYSLSYVVVCMMPAAILYRKKIIVKI
jgi:predicted acyltransferase